MTSLHSLEQQIDELRAQLPATRDAWKQRNLDITIADHERKARDLRAQLGVRGNAAVATSSSTPTNTEEAPAIWGFAGVAFGTVLAALWLFSASSLLFSLAYIAGYVLVPGAVSVAVWYSIYEATIQPLSAMEGLSVAERERLKGQRMVWAVVAAIAAFPVAYLVAGFAMAAVTGR